MHYFWNNGLVVEAEYLWKEKMKFKERNRGDRTIIHQFLLTGYLGFATNFSTKTDTGVLLIMVLFGEELTRKENNLVLNLTR